MCEHKNFYAKVDVTRMCDDNDTEKILDYFADIKINCSDCGASLQFIGVPAGISIIRPASNLDATEIRLPARISTEPINKDPNKIYN